MHAVFNTAYRPMMQGAHACIVIDVCHIELPVGETVAAAPAKKMDQREKESGLVTLAI